MLYVMKEKEISIQNLMIFRVYVLIHKFSEKNERVRRKIEKV